LQRGWQLVVFDDEVFDEIMRGGPKLPAEETIDKAPEGEPAP
jgi:hypothetical protein